MVTNRVAVAFAAFTASLIVLTTMQQAHAASEGIRIRELKLQQTGEVRLVFGLTGAATTRVPTSADLSVSEAGTLIKDFQIAPFFSEDARPQDSVSLALAIDVSGSMAGAPIEDAKAAALRFLALLPPTVKTSLVAFGQTAAVVARPTTDKTIIAKAIRGLVARGETALYDGITLAAARTLAVGSQHNIVVLSDGKDTVSRHTLAEAIAAAKKVGASVTTVGLVTPDYDARALSQVAAPTHGRSLSVSRSAELIQAFSQAARDIASQYVVTYRSMALQPKELDIIVTLGKGDRAVTDTVVAINPRVDRHLSDSSVPTARAPRPLLPGLKPEQARALSAAAMFISLVLIIGLLMSAPARRRTRGLLLGLVEKPKRKRPEKALPGQARMQVLATIGSRATEAFEKLPNKQGTEERLQFKLDRSGWPLRASEFIAIQVIAGFGGFLIGFALFLHWWLGLILAVVFPKVPKILLDRAIEKRRALFLNQLPETLDLLSGSLQAGYSFLQGVDTLIQQAAPPTSTEFRRALTEARLGMPVDDALVSMSERIDADDFRWVVIALNIQRQVGGNLATLLRTVSETLRSRDQVRRQIKVLSAEGKLSGRLLVVLPFLLGGYISMVNPHYIGLLFTTSFGRVMVGVGLSLMCIGVVWMNKLVKIDV